MSTLKGSYLSDKEYFKEERLFIGTYVIPFLCLVGIVTNAVNVLVFSRGTRLKSNIYLYLLWHSLVDLFYILLCLVRYVLKFETFSDIHDAYWIQFYEAYVYIYFTSSLAMLMILLELIIAAKRLLIIMNINLTFKFKFRTVVLICACVSIFSYIPMGISLRVVDQQHCNYTLQTFKCSKNSSQPSYVLTQENVPHFDVLKRIYMTVLLFRGLLAPLLLLILNLTIARKFREVCQRKNRLNSVNLIHRSRSYYSTLPTDSNGLRTRNDSNTEVNNTIAQAKKNLTQMIITINVLFIIANFSATLSYLVYVFLEFSVFLTYVIYLTTKVVLFLIHASGFFVYLTFDKLFRKEFMALFGRTRCCE